MREGQDIAFDGWALRPMTGELFRDGACLRLQDRSLQILTLLLSRPGELVTREELIAHLWPKAVVDYDTGINTAMRKLRIALNDDPDAPRYIETVPRKGYRFIGKIEPATPLPAVEGTLPAVERTGERRTIRGYRVAIAAVIAIGLFVGAITLYEWRTSITRAAPPAAPRTATPAAPPTATPAAPRTAIAVPPFANLTGDASKEYLGDGMAEELINTLNKIQGLKVPARTSTFAYKGRNTDIRQIAKDLGVGTVLQGAVRVADKRIRITAQLINAQDGLHLWSESYEEEFTDLFKLQDTLATAIVTALQPNLHAAAETAVIQGRPTQDVEAYQLYLQGSSLADRVSEENENSAIEYFQRAIARDPKFARAYAGVAYVHNRLAGQLGVRSIENWAAAEQAARHALALDPSIASAHAVLANINTQRGNWMEARTHSAASLSLGGNDGDIHFYRALFLTRVGKRGDALAETLKAMELAPANPAVIAQLAGRYAANGHDAEALKYAGLAIDLGFPRDTTPLPAVRRDAALRAKRYAEAGDIEAKRYEVSDPERAQAIKLVYAAVADPGQRARALASMDARAPRSAADLADVGPCLGRAYRYVSLSALDEAYALANQCLDRMTPGALGLSGSGLWSFRLRPFRQDPRFQAFATRMGFMEYWQQYGPPDDCDLNDGKLTCH